nr:hypothetical protein [Tanacetum cinerariifolium]
MHAIVDGKAMVISESSVRSDLLFKDENDIGADEAVHQEGAPRNHIGGADAQTRLETASKRSSDPPFSTSHIVGSVEDRMEQETDLTDFAPPTPQNSPLSGGHTPGSDEGRSNLIKLMNICTQLSNRVLALEEAKTTQEKVITGLKLRVRRLEKKRKGGNDDQTEELNLTNGADIEKIVEDKGNGEKGGSTADQVSTARPEVSAATPSTSPTTTTIFGDEDLTIVKTLVIRSEKAKEKGVAFQRYKGKSVLVKEEPEKLQKVKRMEHGLAQIESDAELAQRIYEKELAELDRAQKKIQKQEEATIAALTEEFNEIQAIMDDDHELAVRMTHEEQEMYTIEERARLLAEYFERRKKQLATERAEAIKNKPPTRTQVKNRMITYLKHMGNYTHQQLKHKTLEEFQMLYEKEKKWIDDFVLMDSEKEENKSVEPENKDKKGKRIKRVAKSAPKQKSSKKQKMMQEQELAKSDEEESAKSNEEESADTEQENEELRMWLTNELRMWLTIVLDEEETVDLEILSTKYPIVDWESQILGNVDMEDKHVYKIIRANKNTSYHKSLSSMLRKFDRQDLVNLQRLVMKRFEDNTLEGYNLRLWGDLK